MDMIIPSLSDLAVVQISEVWANITIKLTTKQATKIDMTETT